ncbi:ferredoxin reductase [Mycolicibacterium flavescens]|uniref:Ferredoxin reductase n=1 Tax=Mycolicibacterium flavescens TaxID=1776 RepID=A0A1E3RIB4_MYCFV|nr:ferredoxin reductase [Mycolicibacterium flavescens]MCV7283089.1 ferredoxin reductase [Mycolicibacterium flavescens]ODQ89137.1 ferredoxin reductase [Mycolicibacterium flavescens]
MFTQTLTRRVLRSPLVDLLTGPHGVDRYTELVDPTWTQTEARAEIVAVRRQTARSVTLTLAPNRAFTGFRAGQHINVAVEVDGRRRVRPYSPANAEGAGHLELTIGRHDGGLVSNYLYDYARPGMTVGLDNVGGDFVLPADRPHRIVFVSGGSGITPLMSMLRTLRAENYDGEIAFIHYARAAEEACYREELAAMSGVRVLHGYTRSTAGSDLSGRFDPAHLTAAMPGVDAATPVFVCGPPQLADAVHRHHANTTSESFVPPTFSAPSQASGGVVAFADAGLQVTDDGRPLLEQAEAAGLTPESGCRMGICHSCTRRKTRGVVKNLITGAVSGPDAEDVQICVSVPVGDVDLAL